MTGSAKKLLGYIPLTIGLIILAVGSFFVPWREVLPYLGKLTPLSYLAMILLGIGFYAARIARYYYMLGVLNQPRSFRRTFIAYFEAQPMSLLPGGEAFRTLTLRKQVDVPLAKGVPVVFLQSFTENIGLVTLALIGAIVLKQQTVIIFVLVAVYLVLLILLRTRRTADRSRRILNKLPFVNVAKTKFMTFIHRNKTLLSGSSLAVLLLSGLMSTLLASLLLFFVANDMGIGLTFVEAVVAYCLPTVLQNVTFLPGGIGVNEQGSVGILIILGASFPGAVALTIIMRFITLGLGVLLGLGAILLAKLHPALES